MHFNYGQYCAKALKMFHNITKRLLHRLSFFKPVPQFPMTFRSNNFVKRNHFPDTWNIPRICPISNKSYLRLFKDYQPYQFYQYYDEFIKELFWNKLLNFLKRNSYTINTSLTTVKINTLQHYSPNCIMTLNVQ